MGENYKLRVDRTIGRDTLSLAPGARRSHPAQEFISSSSGYVGPFAVVIKDPTTITIQGYNVDKGRFFRNYIILATNAYLEVNEQNISGISSNACLYVDITYSPGYAAAVTFASSLPAQASDHYYIPIAFINASGGLITDIIQIQYGIMQGSGRIF
jgi:hypothetical protein